MVGKAKSAALAASLLIGAALPVRAQVGPMHDWGYGWGWPWGMLLMPLVFVLAIIGLVAVVRWLLGPGDARDNSRSRAREILEERYARGEINREEFEQRRRDLAG